MKRVAILQSNYIPWKGYFDLINSVDEFIFFDDMQYTRRDWRNRNKIKTPLGATWLTIPVSVTGKYLQLIKDTQISEPDWAGKHWRTIEVNYAKAKHFKDFRNLFQGLYEQAAGETHLSQVNHSFIKAICELIGTKTQITWSMDYENVAGKTERLVHICKQAGATSYVSGPAAKAYLDESLFTRQGIAVEYMDYNGYPEYNQLHGNFDHYVSILDLLFNMGQASPKYMKSF